MKKIVASVVAALLLSTAAWAQQKNDIELKTRSEVELVMTNDKGEKEVKRIDAAKANVTPGDTVIFTVTYANKGNAPAADVVIKNPVPLHMVYIDGTAEGENAKIEFSIDKGKTFGAEGKLKLVNAQGKERPATAKDYTIVRWILEKPVEKGETGSVSFRAKVK